MNRKNKYKRDDMFYLKKKTKQSIVKAKQICKKKIANKKSKN